MNTLSLTMRRRLGAMVGFTLVFILVFLVLLANAARPCEASGRQIWLWIAALLGAALAMLVTERRAYEPLHPTESHWEYWSETLWACGCTVVTGIGAFVFMIFLSATGLISLHDEMGARACSKDGQAVPAPGQGPAQAVPAPGEGPATVGKTDIDGTKPPLADGKSTDSAPISGKPVDSVKSDLEESLKKEINDKFSFWGTLFAWLVAIVTLAVTVVIWNLQKGAQDLKDRFETLEGLREFRSNLDKHTLDVKLQDHLLILGNTLESVRDNNPVFQCLRPLQWLLLAARQVESNDFSAQDFSQRIDRVESTLAQATARVSDIQQIKPLALAAALRTLGESLHAVGPRPWLPADWPAQIHRLFVLANRLNAML